MTREESKDIILFDRNAKKRIQIPLRTRTVKTYCLVERRGKKSVDIYFGENQRDEVIKRMVDKGGCHRVCPCGNDVDFTADSLCRECKRKEEIERYNTLPTIEPFSEGAIFAEGRFFFDMEEVVDHYCDLYDRKLLDFDETGTEVENKRSIRNYIESDLLYGTCPCIHNDDVNDYLSLGYIESHVFGGIRNEDGDYVEFYLTNQERKEIQEKLSEIAELLKQSIPAGWVEQDQRKRINTETIVDVVYQELTRGTS